MVSSSYLLIILVSNILVTATVTLVKIFKSFTEALDTILVKTRVLALPTLPGIAKSLPSLPTERAYVVCNVEE